MPLPANKHLGRYKIRSPLGAGGMGEVYLAYDTTLRRSVALKILPADFISDKARLHRFEREAHAASSLNHPNILTIYEIGVADDINFIATEFIDGDSLRERITVTRLKLGELLDVSIQVASALAAAHEEGIVHRDIKPENIMLRRDGLAKVLDFGLAKLTEHHAATVDTQATTRTLFKTDPGVVMGTVVYMSPEQARGLDVDARTDIWSLGCVLYEMLAGHAPFEGATKSDVLAAILDREPPPLSRHSEVVAELEWIVKKSLRKDREERYQTVKELLTDLRGLKQRLDFEAQLERSAPSNLSDIDSTSTASMVAGGATRSAISAEPSISTLIRTKRSVMLALVGLVMAVAAISYYYLTRSGKTAIDSLAVLPFVNVSNDPNVEYLSDGITDSLINSLSQLSNLKVMSRNSVFHYKGREIDAQGIGRALGVRAVLIGRIAQRDDNISISIELVDTSDKSHLWGEQYNRKLSDILNVQTEIARDVSERLRLRLKGEDEKRLAKHYTENAEAYQLYMKGRFYWDKRTREAYRKAIEFFNQAIEKDPNCALAYAGLAGCYTQGDYPLPPKERMPLARQSALKAIELDETLAEPHTALGRVKQEYDWDREGAEKEFKLAIELNPNSSLAHRRYAGFFTFLGKHEEAIAESRKAVALDPLSPLINWSLGFTFYWARRYDEAIEQDHKTLEMDPSFIRSYYQIGMSYEQKGMYEQAFEWYLKGANLAGRTAEATAWKEAYAAAGVRGYYRKQLDLEMAKAEQDLSWLALYRVAVLYAQLGEKEKSLEWLQKAFEERPLGLMFLKIEPAFDNMRSDPRFQDLVHKVGLTP